MKSSSLFPLGLLILGILAPWAVEGDVKAVKGGACPKKIFAQCLRYEYPECQTDWQCEGKKKCCDGICGIKCLDPVSTQNSVKVKPGKCPEVHGECYMLNPPNYCESDGHCVDNLKCCKGMCGKTCIPPVKGDSSKQKTGK
ncbi:antileukoproteinase [Erinaceus europaeus]|uniref:Antileukoproteinase n=1 Tax=Erinaceus europaeus TaxID=9365 RepID=A0ABM3XCX3_ERIEU|nr:antileukoproteinase [Erinaceus europaeus]